MLSDHHHHAPGNDEGHGDGPSSGCHDKQGAGRFDPGEVVRLLEMLGERAPGNGVEFAACVAGMEAFVRAAQRAPVRLAVWTSGMILLIGCFPKRLSPFLRKEEKLPPGKRFSWLT